MTNKINGIDVSECKHHYTNPVNGIIYHGCAIYEQINESGYSQDTLCEQNSDCYFKQLKRLQEENEELKQERLEVARLFDKTCRCDDLQEGTAKCQYFNDDCISIRHCMKKFRSLKDSYKQALEEIREKLNPLNDYDIIQDVITLIKEVLND